MQSKNLITCDDTTNTYMSILRIYASTVQSPLFWLDFLILSYLSNCNISLVYCHSISSVKLQQPYTGTDCHRLTLKYYISPQEKASTTMVMNDTRWACDQKHKFFKANKVQFINSVRTITKPTIMNLLLLRKITI